MFAIMQQNYGKKRCFTLRKMAVRFLPWGACICEGYGPMISEIGIHKTAEGARVAAKKLGFQVVACGDFYEIAATIKNTIHK